MQYRLQARALGPIVQVRRSELRFGAHPPRSSRPGLSRAATIPLMVRASALR